MANPVLKALILIFVQTIALCWAYELGFPQDLNVQVLSQQVREHLQNRIDKELLSQNTAIEDEYAFTTSRLSRFYGRRNYLPAWISNDRPLPQVDALIKTIREANREGLNPDDYNLGKIEDKLREIQKSKDTNTPIYPSTLVSLDILLTEAFLTYGSHLLDGRVNPEKIEASWYPNRYEVDLVLLLQAALGSNTVEESMHSLLPVDQGYKRMRQALRRYRDIAARGGWNSVPVGPKIKKGDSGTRIQALRARLITEGYLVPGLSKDRDIFDDLLEQAISKYQDNHGLKVDGIVGRDTIASLNVSVEDRVRQIELNMERMRWLPKELGKRYVLINIPNYQLEVVEDSKPLITMRAVVGKPSDPSPVLSSEITYLVLNPSWYVPSSIATSEILKELRTDPTYLAKNDIMVYKIVDGNRMGINPATVNWTQVSEKNFNYRFRQRPGSKNVLGRVKFIFPNPFDVYLHDTSSPELFAKFVRSFSHGCMRVEKPMELAEFLMRDDAEWTRENILSAINKRSEKTVWLPEPIPLHVAYLTAWVDENGSIQFRNDIYGLDKVLNGAWGQRDKALTSQQESPIL
ncbi:MAG: L,D-transpeptidase family protein [Thermodesulfobacteriota bacterium]